MQRKLLYILLFTFVCGLHAQRSDFQHISFKRADSIAKSLKGEELYNLPVLAYRLTQNLETDAERFRAIYYWVCHNIRNDYGLMMDNKINRKKFKSDTLSLGDWHRDFKKRVFSKLLNEKRTLCSGYSYLIKELSALAGIECVIVNGYGKTSIRSFKSMDSPNHSWNKVNLNDKWYVCDATWSSGSIDVVTYLFHFEYNDDYFLMDPDKFAEEHRAAPEELRF